MQKTLTPWLLAGVLALAGCDLDRSNPNAPPQELVLTSPEGITGLAIGLQARYGAGLRDFIYPAGLLTDELGATTGALLSYREAEQGIVQPVGLPFDLTASHYRTIKTANDIIANAPGVSLDPGTRSGILTLAYVLKAASIGELLQGFQQVSIDTYDNPTPEFVDRQTALAYTLALLDTAEATLAATSPSAEFNASIVARGFDLRNTLYAMRARYQRMANNHEAAIAAADQVSRTVVSVAPFNDQARNPLLDLTIYVRPRDAWRLAADPADSMRVNFHVAPATITGFFQPLDNYRQFSTNASPIPVYYPDEMRLIKAEALVQLGRLPEAQAVLDSVRTDCGTVVAQPRACLAPLAAPLAAAELLDEIYEQRRFELFATGLRWEDARRLGRVGTGSPLTIAQRCWLPYPQSERNVNPNVPTDPEPQDPPAFGAQCF